MVGVSFFCFSGESDKQVRIRNGGFSPKSAAGGDFRTIGVSALGGFFAVPNCSAPV